MVHIVYCISVLENVELQGLTQFLRKVFLVPK
jgi:hypothetical protein